MLMGEPGSGKTTVLLALLFKYTGKHVSEEQKKKVVFSIPPHKTTFRDDIYSFIKEFCSREWVEVVMGLNESKICRNTGSTIYLFDEVYDANFLFSKLNVGKIYTVLIAGEKLAYSSDIFRFPRPDYEIVYFRKLYRSPAGISKVCVKLKRSMDKEKSTSGKCNQVPKFRFELIPWEMSLSNRQHMTETSPIMVKSYKSLELPELYRSIDKSDFIVTLDLQEKVKELLAVFIPNRIFHQSTTQSLESEYFVHRTAAFDMETIVLVCGRNLTIAALKSQRWLLERMKLKHCHVFIIYRDSLYHGSIMEGIESLGIEVQLLLPFYADIDVLYKCSEVEMKLFERNLNKENVLIVTFDLNLLVALLIDFKFKSYDVHHYNLYGGGAYLLKKKLREKVPFNQWHLSSDCDFCIQSFAAAKVNWTVTPDFFENCLKLSNMSKSNFDFFDRSFLSSIFMLCDVMQTMYGDVETMYKAKREYIYVLSNGKCVHFSGSSLPASCSDDSICNQKEIVPLPNHREKFTHVVFLNDAMPGSSFSIPQLKNLVSPVEPHCRFIHIGSSESYRNFVQSRFKVNKRPFLQTFCYSNSTNIEQLLSMVPCFPGRQLVLLSWNMDQCTLNIPQEYRIMDVSSFTIDENHCFRDVSGGVTHLILVCGKLSESTNFAMNVVKAIEYLNVEEWMFVVCHGEDRRHIESVLLASNLFYLFSNQYLLENPRVDDNITKSIPLIKSGMEGEVLILTWKVSVTIKHSYPSCTIRHLDDMFHPVVNFHDVIFICCGFLSKRVADSCYWKHIKRSSNFYLVSDEDNFDQVSDVLPKSRSFHFSRSVCYFGDIHEQLNRIEVLKKEEPKVLLLTSILDRNIAARVTDRFPEYTVRHLDPMPWASDSLSFTGSEFDRVVLLCDESVDPEARETISVLYTTLSRSKQNALIICHESKAEKMRDLLSLSSVDQVFEQLRSSVNLGENIFSLIQEEHQILEVFVKVIVTRNENQFNSLKCFITECDDPKFDWLFEFVRSMLLTCFSCGHKTARMLNNFLLWKPSKQHPDQVLDWNDFCFLNYTTVEERKKILACIDPQFRSIRFEYKNLEISKLKTMAFTAVVWSQVDMLSHILDQLVKKGFNDRKFYDDLLFKIISMNDSNSLSLVLEKLNLFESDILSWLKATASFISQEMFSMLLSSIKPSGTSALDPKAILPLLASTTTVECFDIFLSFLSANLASFVLAEFRDDDGRNILMLAASNTEVFRLLLDRVSGECDINSLLSQRVNNACSCLRYASDADNIDVVRILVEEYSCNWVEDDVREAILSLVGHTGRNDIDIK